MLIHEPESALRGIQNERVVGYAVKRSRVIAHARENRFLSVDDFVIFFAEIFFLDRARHGDLQRIAEVVDDHLFELILHFGGEVRKFFNVGDIVLFAEHVVVFQRFDEFIVGFFTGYDGGTLHFLIFAALVRGVVARIDLQPHIS